MLGKLALNLHGSQVPFRLKRNGNVHYDVRLDDQRIVRRHIEHIQPRVATHIEVPQQQQSEVELSDPLEVPRPHDLNPTSSQPEEPTTPDVVTNNEPLRRSTRVSRPPSRYGDLVSS